MQNEPIDQWTRMLVVDDRRTMREIVRTLLISLGYRNVVSAEDGSEGLRRLRAEPYGMVVADWNMQPMSGIEMLREMRADANLADIPVIILTAESSAAHVREAKSAGANSYVIKPFDSHTLRSKIEAICQPLESGTSA